MEFILQLFQGYGYRVNSIHSLWSGVHSLYHKYKSQYGAPVDAQTEWVSADPDVPKIEDYEGTVLSLYFVCCTWPNVHLPPFSHSFGGLSIWIYFLYATERRKGEPTRSFLAEDESRPEVGSSSKRREGSTRISYPMLVLFLSPPDMPLISPPPILVWRHLWLWNVGMNSCNNHVQFLLTVLDCGAL